METDQNKNKKEFISWQLFFALIFVFVFTWVGAMLFFPGHLEGFYDFLRSSEQQVENMSGTLKIVAASEPLQLEPTIANPVERLPMNNILEALVRPNGDLQMEPLLAVSWGLIDDYTWEFKLRPNVKFQDGSDFDVHDVVASIERAGVQANSQLVDVLSTFESLEIVDNLTLRIKTVEPDPILLQRISTVLIVPSDYDGLLVGTGPYKFKQWDKGDKIVFEPFDGYWREHAKFASVELYFRASPQGRVDLFVKERADLITFVPFGAVDQLKELGYRTTAIPSLEVQFLKFNTDSEYFDEASERELLFYAIDKEAFVNKLGAYVRNVNQFVSNGVFGFNPNIDGIGFDLQKAYELAKKNGLEGATLQFHLPIGLEVLGDYVRVSLQQIGVNVVVSYLEIEDLLKSMDGQEADLYFLGFRSELADASDFLSTIAYSAGKDNVGSYSNESVDFLIENAATELDVERRRNMLQEAMQIIVEEDFMGLPLFEYETVFGFSDAIEFFPRIDGMIYFDELTIN